MFRVPRIYVLPLSLSVLFVGVPPVCASGRVSSIQYNCEACGKKQDAVTMTELVRLPPVLSLQLVRYEYDFKTMEKKKIKAVVSLPPTLDMGPRIG